MQIILLLRGTTKKRLRTSDANNFVAVWYNKKKGWEPVMQIICCCVVQQNKGWEPVMQIICCWVVQQNKSRELARQASFVLKFCHKHDDTM